MPQGQGPAVQVHSRRIDPQLIEACQRLRRERLVEFHEVQLPGRDTGPGQHMAGRTRGTDPQHPWSNPGGVGTAHQQCITSAQFARPLQ